MLWMNHSSQAKRRGAQNEEAEEIAFLRNRGCITYWQLRGMRIAITQAAKNELPGYLTQDYKVAGRIML